MATVKEIKLKKNGAMVSPVTLIGSVKNLDGTNYSSHIHDDRYYTESEIDSKVSALTSTINGKANSSHTHDDRYYTESEITNLLAGKADKSHNHFSVTSNHSMTWVNDSSFDNGGYYKITVPDCELGKIQICHFTHKENFESEEEIQFYLPSNNNMYFVISTKTTSSDGYSGTGFVGAYVKGGNNFGWSTFSQYIGYGSSEHIITVVYARVL